MSKQFEAIISTAERHHRVFVDKWDVNEIWLSIQVSNGGANCRLTRSQAIKLVDAINKIIEHGDDTDEEQNADQYFADLEVKSMIERGM